MGKVSAQKAISAGWILFLFVAGCGTISEHAIKSAISKGWSPVSFKSGGFELSGFIKHLKGGDNNFFANLNHAAWTSYHGVTTLSGSLNPADFATRLQSVPQIHFVGEKDDIIPESIARDYRSKMTDPSLTKIAVIPGYDHHCCWVQAWPRLQRWIADMNNKNKEANHEE